MATQKKTGAKTQKKKQPVIEVLSDNREENGSVNPPAEKRGRGRPKLTDEERAAAAEISKMKLKLRQAKYRNMRKAKKTNLTEDERRRVGMYRIEYSEQLRTFFQRDGDALWRGGQVPCIEKFAASLKPMAVSMETMNVWRENYPEFKEAWEVAETEMRSIMMDMGALKTYNSDFMKFLLGSVHNLSPVEKRKAADESSQEEFKVNISVEE